MIEIFENIINKKVIEMVETKPNYFEMKNFNTKIEETDKIEDNKES